MLEWQSGHSFPNSTPPKVMIRTPTLAITGMRTAWFAGSCLAQFGHVKVSTGDV